MSDFQPDQLKRVLSLPLVALYGLGITIGAGIYVLVGETAAASRRRLALWHHWGHAGDVRRLNDQGRAIEADGLADGADRPPALLSVELLPFARMWPLEADDAGAVLALRIATRWPAAG